MIETMEELRVYLVKAIEHWRECERSHSRSVRRIAPNYLDAYQSVYASCFGGPYPKAEEEAE